MGSWRAQIGSRRLTSYPFMLDGFDRTEMSRRGGCIGKGCGMKMRDIIDELFLGEKELMA